jgi:branched-chain amino acid transport system substrate-binding protein
MKVVAATTSAFVIGLLIGLVAMYAAVPSMMAPVKSSSSITSMTTVPSGLSGTITIGDLVALTGDLSAYGQRNKVAVDMAINDINIWLASTGSNVTFAVQHEDTATDPATCLQQLQSMAAEGIQVYVGPMTSAEVRYVLPYADANKLVLISQSSTAEDLANRTNSYLFRLVPTDDAQSRAVARVVLASGFSDVIVVARHDPWGDGLSAAFEARYQQIGGTIIDTVRYTPVSNGTYDFSPQLAQIQSDYNTAVSKYGASKVAIVAVSFDELSALYQQATSYKSILSATWFGTDGTAESSTIASSSGTVAAEVHSFSTIYAPTRSDKNDAFTAAFLNRTGAEPDAYAYSAYDATWLAALSILTAENNNGAAVQRVFVDVANHYFGVAGWPDLNANGDRTISDYDIWNVEPNPSVSGTYEWVLAGTWVANSDTVTWATSS